jgi:transcriptional regulator with XRE-family HTH domain
MIRNDRQLSIARKKQEGLLSAASGAEASDAAIYEDLANEVQQEIDEYIEIRDSGVNSFAVDSIDDLAAAVIKARIARRWTQKQLADALGVSEQMVQRDEAREYERAGVSRLAEIAEILGYQLVGEFRPVYLPFDQWRGPTGIFLGVPSGNGTAKLASVETGTILTEAAGFQTSLSHFLHPITATGYSVVGGMGEVGATWAQTTYDASQSLVEVLNSGA